MVSLWGSAERQRRELASAERRLDGQFAHERWTRDLEDLRALVDQGTEALFELTVPIAAKLVILNSADPDGVAESLKVTARGDLDLKKAFYVKRRMDLRLGSGHSISKTFQACLDRYHQVSSEMRLAVTQPEEERKALRAECSDKLTEVNGAFERAVNEHSGFGVAPGRAFSSAVDTRPRTLDQSPRNLPGGDTPGQVSNELDDLGEQPRATQ